MSKYLKSFHHVPLDPPEAKIIQEEIIGLEENSSEAGQMLKALRSQKGWTQKQLQEQAGIDQANISKMESGERPIGRNAAKKFSQIFKMDYRAFL